MNYTSIPSEELLAICVEGRDGRAWEEFIDRFHGVISATVLRTVRRYVDPTPSLVEDLVQETYLKICVQRERLLKTFQPKHPGAVFGFMKVVASNAVHDYFKTANASKRGSGQVLDSLEDRQHAVGATQVGAPARVEREIFLQEIDEMLRDSLSIDSGARDRTIFWLYYRQGLTAHAISALPSMNLSEKGVQSTIWRLTHIVRDRLDRTDRDHGDPSGEKSASGSFS